MPTVAKHLVLLIAVCVLVPTDMAAPLLGGDGPPTAEARVGRPATPGSVAGVARRTTRRTVRRTNAYVNALPAGCARATVYGTALWRCGGVYYQPSGGRYVVVNID